MVGRGTRYGNVKLPMELLEQVDRLLGMRTLGFRSRAEFVSEAVRAYLRITYETMAEGYGLEKRRP